MSARHNISSAILGVCSIGSAFPLAAHPLSELRKKPPFLFNRNNFDSDATHAISHTMGQHGTDMREGVHIRGDYRSRVCGKETSSLYTHTSPRTTEHHVEKTTIFHARAIIRAGTT